MIVFEYYIYRMLAYVLESPDFLGTRYSSHLQSSDLNHCPALDTFFGMNVIMLFNRQY